MTFNHKQDKADKNEFLKLIDSRKDLFTSPHPHQLTFTRGFYYEFLGYKLIVDPIREIFAFNRYTLTYDIYIKDHKFENICIYDILNDLPERYQDFFIQNINLIRKIFK